MALGLGCGRMSFGMKFIRLLIVLLNLAFIAAAITLIALGVYVMRDAKVQQLRPLLNADTATKSSERFSNIEIFAMIMIGIGGILLIIGFLGCCGAFKGFRFLHVIYAVIIGVIIIAEFALVIFFIGFQKRFKSEFVGKLKHSLVNNYVGTPIGGNFSSDNPASVSWDFLQLNLQCCGAFNKNDYSDVIYWNRTDPYEPTKNLTVPLTCCPINGTKNWDTLPANMAEASQCATSGVSAYAQGCYDRLVDLLATYKTYIIIGLVVVGILEISAFIFALSLYFRKTDYEDV